MIESARSTSGSSDEEFYIIVGVVVLAVIFILVVVVLVARWRRSEEADLNANAVPLGYTSNPNQDVSSPGAQFENTNLDNVPYAFEEPAQPYVSLPASPLACMHANTAPADAELCRSARAMTCSLQSKSRWPELLVAL